MWEVKEREVGEVYREREGERKTTRDGRGEGGRVVREREARGGIEEMTEETHKNKEEKDTLKKGALNRNKSSPCFTFFLSRGGSLRARMMREAAVGTTSI